MFGNVLHLGASGVSGRVWVSGSYSFLAIAQRVFISLLVDFLPIRSTGSLGHSVETQRL